MKGTRRAIRPAAVVVLAGAVAGVGLTASSCAVDRSAASGSAGGAATATIPPLSGLVLTFDDDDELGTGRLETAASVGPVPGLASVSASGGGVARVVPGLTGAAVRLSGEGATALVVRGLDTPDPLDPGEADFSFGADVALDTVSEGDGDNGDNVLQRGLYLDATQYKLQLDHGVPSCRIAAGGREALVASPVPVGREAWYRLRCTRAGDVLRLDVSRSDGGAWVAVGTWQAASTVGSIDFGATGPPLAVGAKVDPDGTVLPSVNDQLDGLVDNVVVDVGGRTS